MATEVMEDVDVDVPPTEVVVEKEATADTEEVIESKEEEQETNANNKVIRAQRTGNRKTLRIVATEERKGTVTKHTVYIIECDPKIPGVVTVARRYNDFKWLRAALSREFCGLFVAP